MAAKGAVVLVRPVDTKGGLANHDRAGVDLMDAFPRNVHAFHADGNIVLHDAVRHANEAVKNLLTLRLAQVDSNAALIASMGIERGPPIPWSLAGIVVRELRGTPAQRRHTLVRAGHHATRRGREMLDGLDANDLRAPIGQHLRPIWPRPNDSEIENTHTLKGQPT